MKFSTIYLTLLLAATTRLCAQSVIYEATQENNDIRQYEKAGWNIDLTAVWQNPYAQDEITLDMLLTTPSGKRLTVPCYYDNGASGKRSHWKVRFLPQETGRYTYHFVLKQQNNTTSSGEKTFEAQASGSTGILHRKDPWHFVFDNGTPFRGIGENICWESRSRDDSKFFPGLNEDSIKYNYERMLPLLVAHGGNFFRTWICRWNLPLDWQNGFNNNRYTPSDAYFNPSAMAKMDRLIDLCDSLGLHMMLTLGPGAYSQGPGAAVISAADFFVNPDSKRKYRDRLRYIVARWGYSSAIGAWEFFNEVDNVQFGNRNNPIKAEVIVQWHDSMSTYLKGLDPYGHLVTTSISHRDLAGLNSLANIDFNQKHIYRATRTIPSAIVAYTRNFGKPYVIGEFSYEWDWNKNFDDFADGMDSDFKRGLWYGLFSPTPILPMSWWWEYFDKRGTDVYIKNVRRMMDRMIKTGGGDFDSVAVTLSGKGVDSTEHFAVRCGEEVYVYLHNLTPMPVTGQLQIVYPGLTNAEAYDCEAGSYLSSRPVIKKVGKNTLIDTFTLKPRGDIVLVLK